VAILLFFLLLNPLVALINGLILLLILQIVGSIFKKQLRIQAELNSAPAGSKPKPHTRHGLRIKAAETGALVSGGGMLILLGVLLYLSIAGDITPANTLVIFLGARLQNSVITGGSRSLMNYARSNLRTVADDDVE
jgi:phosphatidylglycerophosphate synthase